MKTLNRLKQSKFYGWLDFLAKTATPGEEMIVFEDVLYYGILSEPKEFKRLNHTLATRADAGNKVIIGYYDVDSIAFHLMLIDQLIGEMRERGTVIDSTLQEKGFMAKRDKDFKSFAQKVEKYRRPLHHLPEAETIDLFNSNRKLLDSLKNTPLYFEFEALYERIDSIKTFYMGDKNKNIRDITFSDYKKMYQGMSREIIQLYTRHGIELIPLKDYLTMSCWMVGERAVIAFPSRYSTEEIGFFSQDKAFYDYIHTMLDGVRREDLSYSSPASH